MFFFFFFQLPFCVLADHKTSSILITIRGSMSMRDIFTDLTATPEKVHIEGLPAGCLVSDTQLSLYILGLYVVIRQCLFTAALYYFDVCLHLLCKGSQRYVVQCQVY